MSDATFFSDRLAAGPPVKLGGRGDAFAPFALDFGQIKSKAGSIERPDCTPRFSCLPPDLAALPIVASRALLGSNNFEAIYLACTVIYFSRITFRKYIGYLNTQYRTNSTLVSPVKMEYGWNFSISGLKMMMKSGLGKIFLKFLHVLTMSFLLLNFDQNGTPELNLSYTVR